MHKEKNNTIRTLKVSESKRRGKRREAFPEYWLCKVTVCMDTQLSIVTPML